MTRRTRRSSTQDQESARSRAGNSARRNGSRTSDERDNMSLRERGNTSGTRARSAGTRPGRTRRGAGEEEINDMTRQDLYRRAQEMGIEGRSQMNKRELMMAVRGK